MKKYTRWGFITFFLPFLFLFQNCEHNIVSSASAETPSELQDLGVSQLKIPAHNHFRHPSSTDKPHDIFIDIYKGTVKDSKNAEFCPGYDFFYSLQYILNHAQLCIESFSASEDVVCSTEFDAPSAILITQDGEKISLGTKDENCKKTQLCSPGKDDFELLIQTFLEIKDSLKCS